MSVTHRPTSILPFQYIVKLRLKRGPWVELKTGMKTSPPRDVGRVRALTELAIVEGFRGGSIDEARTVVAQKCAL